MRGTLEPRSTYEWIASVGKPIRFLNGEYEVLDEIPKRFSPVIKPAYLVNDLFRKDNTDRIVYFDFEQREMVLYQKEIVDPESLVKELEFHSFTTQGEPVMRRGTKKLRGYKEISISLYGKVYRDIKERIEHLFEDDFDPSKLFIKRVEKKKYGQEVTIYQYGNQEIWGLKGLKRRFPKTPEKKFNHDFLQLKPRHIELMEEYKIMRFGKNYILDMGKSTEVILTSQRKVVEFLKEEYDETFSNNTRIKLFQEIPHYYDYIIKKHHITYDRKTRKYSFWNKGYFIDRSIEDFLETITTPSYGDLRDDLINALRNNLKNNTGPTIEELDDYTNTIYGLEFSYLD